MPFPAKFQAAVPAPSSRYIESKAPLLVKLIVIGLPKIIAADRLVEPLTIKREVEAAVIPQSGDGHGHIADSASQIKGCLLFPVHRQHEQIAALHSTLSCSYSERIACSFPIHQAPSVRVCLQGL